MFVESSGSLTFFVDVFNKFWGSYHIPILFIVSLIILYKSDSVLSKKIFVYPFLLCMLTVYNPILMHWVINLLNIPERYYRFYWLTPFALIIGIAFADYYVGNKKDKRNELITFAVLFMLFLMVGTRHEFKIEKTPGNNVYGISEENIGISNIIQNDKKNDEETIIFADTRIVYTLRMYDASLLPVASRYEDMNYLYGGITESAQIKLAEYCEEGKSYILIANSNIEYDVDTVKKDLSDAGVQYFIRNKSWYSDTYMAELGYKLIGETANYQVYKVIL